MRVSFRSSFLGNEGPKELNTRISEADLILRGGGEGVVVVSTRVWAGLG